ncbi:MAG: phage tail assembly protein [Desulfobacteraceae bacterium]|nr:phage tail assembly protein [Desulfobacteraceae bacterium]
MAEKIKLKHPFEWDGKKIETVTWRRPKGKDIVESERDMQDRGILAPGDGTRTLFVVARIVGLASEAVEEMDLEDYLTLAGRAGNFL